MVETRHCLVLRVSCLVSTFREFRKTKKASRIDMRTRQISEMEPSDMRWHMLGERGIIFREIDGSFRCHFLPSTLPYLQHFFLWLLVLRLSLPMGCPYINPSGHILILFLMLPFGIRAMLCRVLGEWKEWNIFHRGKL